MTMDLEKIPTPLIIGAIGIAAVVMVSKSGGSGPSVKTIGSNAGPADHTLELAQTSAATDAFGKLTDLFGGLDSLKIQSASAITLNRQNTDAAVAINSTNVSGDIAKNDRTISGALSLAQIQAGMEETVNRISAQNKVDVAKMGADVSNKETAAAKSTAKTNAITHGIDSVLNFGAQLLKFFI